MLDDVPIGGRRLIATPSVRVTCAIGIGFFVLLSGATDANALGCALEGKTIQAQVTQCYEATCIGPSKLRVLFLGDKILYFKNNNLNEGQIFYVGRTVKIDKELGLSPPAGTRLDGYATAVVTPAQIKLVVHGHLVFEAGGKIYARFAFSTDIDVVSCSSCKIARMDSDFATRGSPNRKSHLGQQTCAIGN